MDGEITIRLPIVDWPDSEMAIEVLCDAGGVLTKGGCKSQIGICGIVGEKVNGENRDNGYLGGGPDSLGARWKPVGSNF